MPTRSASPVTDITPAKYHCYRCGQDKDFREDFYHYADGSPISGCKACHREMAKERHRAAGKPGKPAPVTAQGLTILSDARPTPMLMEYRCEGCGKRVSSTLIEGPRGWKRVRLTGSDEDAATLCTRCTASVTRAIEVFKAVNARRAQGKGQRH